MSRNCLDGRPSHRYWWPVRPGQRRRPETIVCATSSDPSRTASMPASGGPRFPAATLVFKRVSFGTPCLPVTPSLDVSKTILQHQDLAGLFHDLAGGKDGDASRLGMKRTTLQS